MEDNSDHRASSGIGAAAARLLADTGANLMLAADGKTD